MRPCRLIRYLTCCEDVLTSLKPLTCLARRAVNGRTSHRNASIQMFAEGPNTSRVIWSTDFMPNEMGADIAEMVEQGAAAMKRTLEADDDA
jgi:hypothetical protein